MDYLDNDIKFVGGVGEARARLLDKELGIRTLGDMLRHYPCLLYTSDAADEL